MTLKEFIDAEGVVILQQPTDLQEVVILAGKLGLNPSQQYAATGKYPFFFSLKDCKLLTKAEGENRPEMIDVENFRALAECILKEVKENVDDETVYVQCTDTAQYSSCLDYFNKATGQGASQQELTDSFPFFNLQDGHLYPAYCLKRPSRIISYEEFRRTFLVTKEEKEETNRSELNEILSDMFDVIRNLESSFSRLSDLINRDYV